MQAAKAEAAVRDFERAFEVLQYQIAGWSVWPLLRLHVGYALQKATAPPGGLLTRTKLLSAAVSDSLRILRLRRSRFVVKTYVSGLVDLENGRYKDAWFGDLLATLPDTLQVDGINNPSFLARRSRAACRGQITSALFDGLALLASRIAVPREVRLVAAKFADLVAANFGSELLSPARIHSYFAKFYASRQLYRWLFDRVQPEAVLLADFGEYALVAAAKEAGATVLELQHGVIYGEHHGYGWTSCALPYRSVMPVPDRLLLYGEYWREQLLANGFWGDRLSVVGSLRLDAFRRRRALREPGETRQVLVTTQGIDTERVLRFVGEYLKVEPSAAVRVVVKLHPVYEPDRALLRHVIPDDSRVSVLLGTDDPSTFDLLVRADLHVSISSTCHFEALGLGVPTAILPFSTHEIMAPLHQAGHAAIVTSPEELRSLVWRERSEVDQETISDYYFEPNALANLRTLLGTTQPAVQEARALRL